MVFNLFSKAPSKPREYPGFGVLERFSVQCDECVELLNGHHLPVSGLSELGRLFDLHNLDVIQVFCETLDDPAEWINLALLNNPRLRA